MVRIALCFALFRLFTSAVTVWIHSNKRCIRVEPRHLRFPLTSFTDTLRRAALGLGTITLSFLPPLFSASRLPSILPPPVDVGLRVTVGRIMLLICQQISLFFEAIWLVLSRAFVECCRCNRSIVAEIYLAVITPNIRWAKKRLPNIRRVPRELSHACFLFCGWSWSYDHLGPNVHPPLFATPLTF